MPDKDTTLEKKLHLSKTKQALLAKWTQGKNTKVADEKTILRRSVSNFVQLSFAQQRLWFLDQLEPGSTAYLVPTALQLDGDVEVRYLVQALQKLIDRHESLRTIFIEQDGQPVQMIQQEISASLPVVDLQGLKSEFREQELRRLASQETQRVFDLALGPLLRTTLLHLEPDKYALLLTLHHIITDGWSNEVFVRELTALYRATVDKQPSPLPPLQVQYADYALWQRGWLQGEVLKNQLTYWRTQLAGATPLALPADHPRPAIQSQLGASQSLHLSSEITQELHSLSRQENVTLFMLLLASFQVLLTRYSEQSDISVGTPIANRQQTEVENVIGFFANTLVLRTDLSGNPSFVELLQRVREVCLSAYAHQDLPFEQIVEALELERDLSRTPLFQVMFVLQNAPHEQHEVAGIQMRSLEVESTISKFDLTFTVAESQHGLHCTLEYNSELFEIASMTHLLDHWQTVLQGILHDPHVSIGEVSLLTEWEHEQILGLRNTNRRDYPQELGVHQLFEQQVQRAPDAVALDFEECQLSYEELNRRADQLASYLQRQGVRLEVLVGIYMTRSLEMVIALLAVLKAGGAYLPLDPDYPVERVAFMLADADVKIILTHQAAHSPFSSTVQTLDLDTQWEQIASAPPSTLPVHVSPENLAYMIYTSGSTGKPKGTMNTHQGLGNYLHWRQEEYHLSSCDRVLQKTPYSFDVSVWEFFWPLMTGASLIMARPEGHRDPAYLRALIVEQAITTLHFVPSMLHVFLQESDLDACLSLRQIMCSGEALSADLQASFFARFSEQVQLHNLYGPTEAAIDVTSWTCQRTDEIVPIGVPIANTQIYLLDSYMQPVPIGVAGELYIGGLNLARGYLGRADLTGERFIAHPFSTEPGQRLYRTGDLARHLPDGSIEYLGRLDQQVKIRGQRIELGEIETTLRAQVGVEECVVLAREDRPGEKRLVAYVVEQAEDTLTSNELRALLQERLPSYMIPAAFVLLDTLPLTSNGKVDRRALPLPEQLHPELAETFVAPGTAVENILARIWSQLLRVEQVGVHDNFFALGGDSILSIQVVSRARAAGLHITPKQLFQYQSIAQLARVVTATAASLLPQTLVTGDVPLTPIQHWFFTRQLPAPQHYNQAVMLSTVEPLRLHWLQQALRHLVLHHDALRLRFQQSTDGWQQEIVAPLVTSPGLFIDLSGLPEQQRLSAQLALAETAQAQFELNAGLLLKPLYFLHGSGQPAYLLLIIHHLAVDGVSWRILLEDLETAYGQLASRQPISLADKTSSWQAWSNQLGQYAQTPQIHSDLSYWLDPARTHVQPLPQDLPASETTFASSRAHRVSLSREYTRALLQEVSEAYHTQITEVLLTALVQAFARWTGQSRLLIDLEGHGREELIEGVDLTRTVGWFTTLFPVLFECETESHPIDALKAVKEQMRQVPHKGMSYGLLRFLTQNPEVVAAFAEQPQAQVVFNYLGQFDASFSPTSLFTPASTPTGATSSPLETRPHLLEITGSIEGEQLHINWQYSQEVHQRETIEQLAQAYLDALIALIEQCQVPEAGGYTPSDFPLVMLNQSELDALVAQIPQAQSGRPGQAIEDIYPLSPMQTGLLFHSLYTPEAGVYGNQLEWTIRGEVNVAAWQEAWRYVIERHSSLRTLFVWEGVRQPLQVVLKRVELSCELQDWRSFSPLEQQQRMEHLRLTTQLTSAQLGTAPLLRLALLHLQDQTYTFHLNMHHLITDGWSQALLLTEVQTYYQALCQGKQPQMTAVRPYRDYLLWLQQHDLAQAEHFWRGYLRGLQTPTRLPGRTETTHAHWTQAVTQQVECSVSLAATITAGAQQQHVTLNTLIQGAWALLLSRYSGENEVLFGATTTGRPPELPGVETMFGVFINTLPVRVQVSRQLSAGDWLRQLQSQQVEAREYEYTPLAQIQSWSEIPTGQPLLESLVVFQNYPEAASVLGQSEEMTLEGSRHEEQTNFPLALLVVPQQNTLVLSAQYDEARFEGELIRQLLQQLQLVLQALVERPEQPLERISLLSMQEREQILVQWNATNRDYPQELSVHQLFEQQVAHTPDAVALVFEEQCLTYDELNRRANQLAHYLQQQGVGPDVLVGICLERSLEMVVGLLGILKAGGAYVPIDPSYPAERIARILKECQPRVVLSQRHLPDLHAVTSSPILLLDAFWHTFHDESTCNLSSQVTPENLAYMIYTSGSTGVPKGAGVYQKGFLNLLTWFLSEFDLSAHDQGLVVTSFSFDLTQKNLFAPLLVGGCVNIQPSGYDIDLIYQSIAQRQITRLNCTPSMFYPLLEATEASAFAPLKSLRTVFLGGEAIALSRLWSWMHAPQFHGEIVNTYGPTECSDVVAYHRLSETALTVDATIPLGRPIANTQLLILDERMQLVPPLVTGEIYIAGRGVGAGYLFDTVLTDAKFVPNPFAEISGERLYKTGDLARYRPDGALEFLRRNDQQVKLRGYRIELGEIEATMRARIGVEECVVLAREDMPGEKRLVAYVVGQAEDTLTSSELRAFLQERLPAYMVPSAFILLDALPLTPNGKVDRRALPVPEQLHPELAETFIAPGTEMENILAHIWSQLLRLEQVGVHDNFFALGGDSILSIQVVSHARAAGLHLTPKQLFQYPSIAQLARVVTTTTASQSPQTLVTGPVPLTPIQHWFFGRQIPTPQYFNQAIILATVHPLRLHWLHQALSHLVRHHDALRLRFQAGTDGWQQEIADVPATSTGLSIDLSGLPEQQRLSIQLALAETAQAQLDLNAGLLLRSLYFLHGSAHPAYLLLIIHHLAVDGVSWRIFLEDLETAYGQLSARQPISLADKTSSWQAWSNLLGQYAQTPQLRSDLSYWLDPTRTHVQPLPQDLPASETTFASSRAHRVSLSREYTRALLQEVSEAYHTQITEVLLAALVQAFARWTGQSRVLIDLEGHGREELIEGVDLTRTIGWFTTLFPVLFDCEVTSHPIDVLKAVKEQMRQVPHKGMSYGLLRFLTQDPELIAAFAEQSQAQVVFNYLGQFDASFSPASLFSSTTLDTGASRSSLETRPHLLEVIGSIEGEQLHISWQYSQKAHHPRTIEDLAQAYMDALIALIEQCQAPEAGGYTPSDFPLVTLNQSELDALVAQIPQAQRGRPGQAIEDIYPLSPMQTGLLFHSLYTPEAGVYGNQFEWIIQGEVNVAAWQEAWRYVIARHSLLRTLFVWEDVRQPLQVVLRQVELSCELQDWRSFSPLEQQQRMEQLRQATQLTSQDLGTAPLFRLALLRLQDQTYTFHLNMHHLITDGWSQALLLTEVQTCYQALCQGKQPQMAAVRPYRDYLLWLQQHDLTQAEHFWRGYLLGLQTPTRLPGRTETTHPHWTTAVTQQVECSVSLTSAITSGAQKQHVTLNTLIQGAWALLLSRYSGEDEVLFGATTTGRPPELPGVETMFGVFINTLPVRVQVSRQLSAGDWLRQLQSQQIEAREYEYTPLMQIQNWSEIPTGQPLLESLVIFQNYPVATSVLGQSSEMTLEESRHQEQTNYPLVLWIFPDNGTLLLRVQYDETRFTGEMIARMLQQLQLILESFVEQPEQPLEHISLLSAQERQQVLIQWNTTEQDYPQELSVHQLFEQQVARTPDAVAVLFEDQALTYAMLNHMANQLASSLQDLGVGPEVLVGICMPRSLEMVLGLLGVLKAGGAYLPLDPAYPQERLAFMLQDAQVELILTHTSVQAQLPPIAGKMLYIDQLWTQFLQMSQTRVQWTGSSDQLAYVIYTSGSTGRPKAVMGTHCSIINRFSWMWQAYPFESQEICCQKTNLSFVDAVWEIFGPLLQGMPLVIIPDEIVKDPSQLCVLLERQAVTRIVLVPSLLRALLTEEEQVQFHLRRLTLWVSSGEPLTVELAHQFQEALPEARLLNLYGSSEVAADVTYYEVDQPDLDAGMPLGRPIANTQVYLLDTDLQPVPIGVHGEIYIGGVGVARGYYGRAEITAEKFIPDPFHQHAGARLYRTGDLGSYRANGLIDYQGRSDQQVKLRGYRIELGEVEAALRAYPTVEEGIVQLREDRPGETRLVAYVVGQPDVKISSHELRTALHMQVPSYMVPSTFVFLAALPLTPNGKVDRRALPAPETIQVENNASADRDSTPLEDLLVGIWSQVLARPMIGLHENFFEVGGHSLLATRLIGQVRRVVKVELPLRTVFEAPTIAAFAQRVEQAMRQDSASLLPPLEIQTRPATIPLSFAQQRLWFLDQLEPGSTAYLIPIALRIQGELDVSVLEDSLQTLVQRHESLRTTFMEHDGEAVQVIHAARQVQIPVLDLLGLAQEQREQEVRRLAEHEAQQPCDLVHGPLLRATILRLETDQHVLLLTQHHIITDGWSNSVLVRELTTLYHAFTTGQASPLSPLPIQYADYTLWQRQWLQGEILEAQMAYWREQLTGITPLDLPTDHSRSAVQTFQGRNQTWQFSPQFSAELQSLSQQQNVTLFMLLLASFQVLLMRYSGQNDISVGTPIANRQQAEIEDVIGFFVNTLVMRTDLTDNPTFAQLLQRVREICLGAYAHQDLPFEKIVEELSPERDMSRPPLFQVLFVLQNTPQEPGAQTGLSMSLLDVERTTSMFDLTLFMGESEQGLYGTLQYNTDLFEADTIIHMLNHWQTLLARVVENPHVSVQEVPLLSTDERAYILETWNATQHEYPLQGIHQLFEQQVLRTPDVVAVAFEEQMLTYAELNRRANQLAHYLQQQEVGPDIVVGICMERCSEIAVAVLAVLKAGGTYLPLDPSYPRQRLAFLLQDAHPAWILTQTALLPLFAGLTSETQLTYLSLDQPLPELAQQSTQNLATLVSAEQLAYVIYTSGSTGRPKGVMLSHQALLNMCTWQARELPLQVETRVLQFAPLNFDVSCQELFTTWQSGGTLVILPSDEMRRDPEAVLEVLARQHIERIFVPYIALQQLALAAETRTTLTLSLHSIITAGEQLQITPPITALIQRLPKSVLYNHYGPSESHVVTSYALRDDPQQWPVLPPIGRPINNTQIYVLDALGQLVPLGIVGELYIGGDNLARGYVGQSKLTAERFLPHPFSQLPGSRLYRTGDLARYRSDGNLEFLGRVDQQIKLRGFRIEPGEIEAVLASFPSVKESIVILDKENAAAAYLVAYLVPSTEHEIDVDELRRFVRGQLPDYMLPSFFISLPALPLTASGKIDRKSLPGPSLEMSLSGEVLLEPQTPIQELVAAQWSEVLLQPRISIDANFFALGGHSLLATQIVGRLRQVFQLELPVRSLFQSPTIRGLAQEIEHLQRDPLAASMPPLVPGDRRQPQVLSFAQERFWLLEQLDRSGTSMPAALRLHGRVDVAALQQSFEALVQRHEILRTTFTNTRGQLIQIIALTSTVSLPLIDLRHLSTEASDALLTQLVQQAFQQTFDLVHGPLLHATLLRLGEQDHVLFLALHHILSDGWSTGLLVRDLSAFYRSYTTGEPVTLPELPIQYADYAHWQREWFQGTVLQEQLTYWQEQLLDLPELLDLPLDYPRQALQTYAGRRVDWQVPRTLTDQIKQLSQREHSTLFMTLLASWQILLMRYSGQHDFATGTFIANRTRPELENLIGVFVNTLVLRADLHGNPSFLRLLERVRHMTLDAYAHQDVPFEKLLESLPIERSLSHTALFQVLFTLQNYPFTALELPELSWKPLGSEIQNARFDLIVEAREQNNELVVSFEYNTSLLEAQTIERMYTHWQILLEAIVAHPEHAIEQLPLMTPAEIQLQLARSSSMSTQRPAEESLQQIFEQHAALSPDAIAVLDEQGALTYAEVNQRANQLAHHLRRQGVGPDTFVGVALERCPDLIVALLAILKAGGAYVPLDPSYPAERLALMLAEADPLLVLTQAAFEPIIAAHTAQCLCLDTMEERWENEPVSNPSNRTMPEHLTYMIYTSGSTGVPKGVMIPHANVLRLLSETQDWFHFTSQDTWTFFHSYAFDFSVWEIWGALLTGGRLLIVPYDVSREPGLFYQLLCREAVTVLNQTPSAFQQLIQAETRETLSAQLALRLVVFGGEALELKRLAPWIERHNDQHLQLINMYGITETTVHVTYRAITRQDIAEQSGSVIGCAIPDLSCYVLDEQLQLMPQGVPGELYVGGPGLARGYWQQPTITAERFIPHPFSTLPGERLYRTGDRVRLLATGELEYLGRNDQQIKLRGFRIELGEIAAVLEQLSEVREAQVVLREGSNAQKYLVAYVIPQHSEDIITTHQLQAQVRSFLPEYMVPTYVIFLEKWPVTLNGKINVKALPAPTVDDLSHRTAYRAPQTPLQEELVVLWTDVLQTSQVGIQDHFFEVGGNSLLAVQLLNRMQERLGITLSFATLFNASTIEQQAALLQTETKQRNTWNPLVTIQHAGHKNPFFCIHPVMGTVYSYVRLAHSLRTDRPFYGLQARGFDSDQTPFSTVEEMATAYVEALTQVQPEGPYFLGGHSSGGMVAFEMARQLQAQGAEIALLALLDTVPGTGQASENLRSLPSDNALHARVIIDYLKVFSGYRAQPLALTYEQLCDVSPEGQLQIVLEQLKAANQLAQSMSLDEFMQFMHVLIINQAGYLQYQPGNYHGQLTVLRCEEAPHDFQARWAPFITQPVEEYTVPGNHFSMLTEPHVTTLATQLQKCIDEAESKRL